MFVHAALLLAVTAIFGNVVDADGASGGRVIPRHEPVTIYDIETITITICEPPRETEIRPIPTAIEPPAPPMSTITLPVSDSTIVTVNPPSTTSVFKWTSSMETGVPTTTADEVSSIHTTSLLPTPEGNVAAKIGVPVVAMGPLLAMAFMPH